MDIRAAAEAAVASDPAAREAQYRATASRLAHLEAGAASHNDLAAGVLGALASVLRPVQRLEDLIDYEERRLGEVSPVLPALRAIVRDLGVALSANGVAPLAPTVGEPLDADLHELPTRGGSTEPPEDEAVREVVRPGYIHAPTGRVLVRAVVVPTASRPSAASVAAAAAAAASAAEVVSTPRGSRIHEVQSLDTLPGLALRYGVQQAQIMRLNRLPSAAALHSRKTLRLPPATTAAAPIVLPARVDEPKADEAGGGGAATPRSLAGRIAARRAESSGRRRSSDRTSGSGEATPRGPSAAPTAAAAAAASDASVDGGSAAAESAAQVERVLRATLEGAPAAAAHASSQSRGAGLTSACEAWLARRADGLTHAVSSALLYPLRAVTPPKGVHGERVPWDSGALASLGMRYVRALAEHGSRAAVVALLSRDGDLLRALADIVWSRALEAKAEAEADAAEGAAVAADEAPAWKARSTAQESAEATPASTATKAAASPVPSLGAPRAEPSDGSAAGGVDDMYRANYELPPPRPPPPDAR